MEELQNIVIIIETQKNHRKLLTSSTTSDGNEIQVTHSNQKRNNTLFVNICK